MVNLNNVTSLPFYSLEYWVLGQTHYERYYSLESLKERISLLDLDGFEYEICECRVIAIDCLHGEEYGSTVKR